MTIKAIDQNIKINDISQKPVSKKPVIHSQAKNVQAPVVKAISGRAQVIEVTQFKDFLDDDKKRVQKIETESGVTDTDRSMQGNYVKSIYYPSLNKTYLVALKKVQSGGFPVVKQILVEAHEIDRYNQAIKSTVDVGANLRARMRQMGLTVEVR